MKEKGFWTRPREHLDLTIKIATGVVILVVQEWRYALVLLLIVAVGGLITLLLRFLRRKEDTITVIRIE